MNHCYIIKIWNCVHMNKVKKLNDYDIEFFFTRIITSYNLYYVLHSHDVQATMATKPGSRHVIILCAWGRYII